MIGALRLPARPTILAEMAHTPAWRNFKRMQDLTVAAAVLIYAAGAVRAFALLGERADLVVEWILVWPAFYLSASLTGPLLVPVVRRWLAKYVWMSFQAGFGQTPVSIVTGMALLMAAGLLIYRQVADVAATGQVGANVFSAYAAGIGVLGAQAILVRLLERHPDVKPKIEIAER